MPLFELAIYQEPRALEGRQEARRRDHVAAFAEDRLDHHRGDVPGVDRAGEQPLHRRHRRLAAARPRVGDVMDPGQERPHAGVVLGLGGGQAERPVGAPVEPAEEGDHVAPAGGLAGQLDRRLDRLGAAVAEEDGLEALGGDRGDRLRRLDHRKAVGGHRGVEEAVDLGVDRLDHRRMAMTEVGNNSLCSAKMDLNPPHVYSYIGWELPE